MKKNELISMVDRVIQLGENYNDNWNYKDKSFVNSSFKYATFLNTPLNISKFVPAIKVGDKWEVLEMPEYRDTKGMSNAYSIDFNLGFDEAMEEYQTAKDNVIFEGFEVYKVYSDKVTFTYRDRKCTIGFKDGFFSGLGMERINKIEQLINYKFYAPYIGLTLTKKGVEVSGLNNK